MDKLKKNHAKHNITVVHDQAVDVAASSDSVSYTIHYDNILAASELGLEIQII